MAELPRRAILRAAPLLAVPLRPRARPTRPPGAMISASRTSMAARSTSAISAASPCWW
ncbi:hypothetical protein [Teichococcus aestuarii]|uniref:hypothetical protein n=1 Tax=Teichococcus aestuarii TaxID=568898 RepID=UPI00360F8BDC